MKIKHQTLTPTRLLLRRLLWFIQHVPTLPATERQILFFERLGLPVPRRLGKIEAWHILTWSSTQPAYKDEYGRWQAEKEAEVRAEQAEGDREDREAWGDEVFETAKKWEAIAASGEHFCAVIKKGSKLINQVVCIDGVDVEELKTKFDVNVLLLYPRRLKDREMGDHFTYLEWDRDITVKPEQILFWERVPQPFDDFESVDYDRLIRHLGVVSAKYE